MEAPQLETDILLVEDDATDVAIARRALRRSGLEDRLGVCRDGRAALERLGLDGDAERDGAPLPRVVFLDLKMPRVDGFEVLRVLREEPRTRRIPVVVLSASEREEDVSASYQLGANSFLVKRFGGRQPGSYLADAARYWLHLNRAPD